MTSVSIKPDWTVLCDVVRVINYELLKHVVNVLISDDRQRWIHCRTKLPRFIPTHIGTTRVETIVIIVQCVAFRDLVCVDERNSCITYTPCPEKGATICLCLCQRLTNFQKSFTDRLSNKFCSKSDDTISHHTPNASLHYAVKYWCQKKNRNNLKHVSLLWVTIHHRVVHQCDLYVMWRLTITLLHVLLSVVWKNFRATVCKTVRPMLSDRCLWPNGRMDQDETWHEGRPWPMHIVLDADPAPPKRGHSCPQFSAHVCGDKTAGLDGSRCHLVRRYLGSGDIVYK